MFLAGFPLLLIALLGEAALGFGHGITAADPHATGTFAWDGVSLLQTRVTYTFVNGHGTYSGGAMTPLAWVLLVVGTVIAGRLWRVVLRSAGGGRCAPPGNSRDRRRSEP